MIFDVENGILKTICEWSIDDLVMIVDEKLYEFCFAVWFIVIFLYY